MQLYNKIKIELIANLYVPLCYYLTRSLIFPTWIRRN